MQQGHGEHDLGLQVELAHDFSPDQEIEFLVGAPHLHVGLQRHRVVSLGQRVQELVDTDGLVRLEAFGEVVPFQDPGDGVLRSQANPVLGAHAGEPLAVELYPGLHRIENLEDLLAVGLRILLHLGPREHRACLGEPRGVADEPREIADEKDHVVPQLLEVSHLPHDHRVSQVDVGRRRVEPYLHPKRLVLTSGALQLRLELLHTEDLRRSLAEDLQLLLGGKETHNTPRSLRLTHPRGLTIR